MNLLFTGIDWDYMFYICRLEDQENYKYLAMFFVEFLSNLPPFRGHYNKVLRQIKDVMSECGLRV